MIMTNLGCDVKTCVHNDNKLCCLKEIEVAGKGAVNPEMTCCNSFAKEKGAFGSRFRRIRRNAWHRYLRGYFGRVSW